MANFCPICRELRPFRLMRLERVNHVYNQAIGPGQFTGHSILCCTCDLELAVPEGSKVQPLASPEEALRAPDPAVTALHQPRIELEKRRTEGRLSAAERTEMLEEPFALLESMASSAARVAPKHHADAVNSQVRTIGYLFGAMTIGSVGAACAYGIPPPRRWDRGPSGKQVGYPLMAIGVLLLLAAVYFFVTATRRRVRSVLHPFLTRALSPLAPTVEELDQVLEKYRGRKSAIGRYLGASELHLANQEFARRNGR
ncbi:MAG TPA: hypothetical protein VNM14_12200 [Planctomycetota bacterium]|nr:hypothetical protein [Planctomycetota bacterium]